MPTENIRDHLPGFDFIVFDIETTGLSYTKNEIIEIGAVRYSKGVITDEFSCFIKPQSQVPLFIYKLTKIKEEDLKSADNIKTVLKKFLKFLEKSDPDTVIICHNAEFDINFINYHLNKQNLDEISMPVLDTLILSRIFLPFLNNHQLGNVAEYFNIDLSHAHRAIYDAKATVEIFLKITDFVFKYVKPEQISFLVTIAEFIEKDNSKQSKFSSYRYSADNTGISSLLLYLTKLRNHIIRFALNRDVSLENPYSFSHYNSLESNPDSTDSPNVEEVFGNNGLFNKSFENYEYRQGQIDMSKSVLEAFEKEKFLLVEAGTGVGKSLAYLIPSLLFSIQNKKKIVISTNTKNLQEQLLFKDLPLIIKAVNLKFSAVLVKGRDNYLCARKWQDIFEAFTIKQANVQFNGFEAYGLLFLYLWIANTKTGDISENASFTGTPYYFIWKKIATDRHLCSGRKCRFYGKCFLMDIRQKAEKANLVIINHSLLFSDFQNEKPSLGEIEYLIFDEAHNLLHSASSYLGFSLSYPDLQGFLNSIFSVKNSYQTGMIINLKNATLKSIISEKEKESIIKIIDDLIDYMDEKKEITEKPFRLVGDEVKTNGNYNKYRITQKLFKSLLKTNNNIAQIFTSLSDIQNYLKDIFSSLKKIHLAISVYEEKKFADQDIMMDFLEKSSDRIVQFLKQIDSLVEPDLNKNAYWLSSMEINIENYPKGIFNYAPVEVNDILPDLMYSKVKSLVLTSATMSLRNSFKFMVSTLGLDRLKSINPEENINEKLLQRVVPSPFDYDKQALIVNTTFLPNASDPYFLPQSKELIKGILDKNRVGSMILFTSYKDLSGMYEALEQSCYEKDILLLAQSLSGSRNSILRQFIEKRDAVLLGTSSFWEGVDVQGESLSLLVLYKLPFQVPTDPIVEAYLEKLDNEGKNSFMHYSLPNALLKMRQGIGRLIRSKTDQGVILILDNRISTKYYGKYFQEITPTKINNTKNPTETIDLICKKLRKISPVQ